MQEFIKAKEYIGTFEKRFEKKNLDEFLPKIDYKNHKLIRITNDPDEEREIAFLDKNDKKLSLEKQMAILEKVARLRNIDPQDICMKEISPEYITDDEFSENNICFANLIASEHDLVTDGPCLVENLSIEERIEIVNFLKNQNKLIMDNINFDKNVFLLMFSLHIDSIIKISPENEFKYFEKIFKDEYFDFKEVLNLLLVSRRNIISYDINKKIIEQYCDYFGTEKIKEIYNEFKKEGAYILKNIKGIKYSNHISEDNLFSILKIVNEKTKDIAEKNGDILEVHEQEIELNMELFSIKIGKPIDIDFVDKMHRSIEALHNAEIFLSIDKNKIFVKHGNVKEIANNYKNFLEAIIQMQMIESNSLYIYLSDEEKFRSTLRESYLKSIIGEKNETKNKKKI